MRYTKKELLTEYIDMAYAVNGSMTDKQALEFASDIIDLDLSSGNLTKEGRYYYKNELI